MEYFDLSAAIVSFVIGILIKYKKAAWLIAGYNTASPKDRDNFNIPVLCRVAGNFAFFQSFYWAALAALCLVFPPFVPHIMVVGCALSPILLLLGINYINANGRYKEP